MFNDNHRFIEPVFMMTVRGFFFVCLTLCMSMSHADHKPITRVYYYHNMPPYILPDQTGLYGAYLNLLSERLPENDFTLTFLPRGRINWLLENEDLDGIVIGVNPLWFNDSEQEKHVWTSPFELDRDVVIFHKDEQCVYEGPQSLHDKTITFVEGFYLFGISEAIDSNKIDYVGTSSQLSVIRMINARRVEAGVLSEASLYYYLKMDSSLDSV